MIKKFNITVNKDIKRITSKNGFFSETCITTLMCSDLRKVLSCNIKEPGTKAEANHGSDIIITIDSKSSFAFQAKKISLISNNIEISLNSDFKIERIRKTIEKYKRDLTNNQKREELIEFEKKMERLLKFKQFSQAHLQFIAYLAEQKINGSRVIPFFLFYVSDSVISKSNLQTASCSLMIADSFKIMNTPKIETDYTLEEFKAKKTNILPLLFSIPEWLNIELRKKSTIKRPWYKGILETIGLSLGQLGSIGFSSSATRETFQNAVLNNVHNIEECSKNLIEEVSITRERKKYRSPVGRHKFHDFLRELTSLRLHDPEFKKFITKNIRIEQPHKFDQFLNLQDGFEKAMRIPLNQLFYKLKLKPVIDYLVFLSDINSESHIISPDLKIYLRKIERIREQYIEYNEVSIFREITPESKECINFIEELTHEVKGLKLQTNFNDNDNISDDYIFGF